MGKHEQPPFRMILERGRLVPATADDAERLDTYRNGTTYRVRFVEEKDRVLVRKWWAVLGRAVKECSTPWQNKDEASEAIKLALGIVNLSKTVGGSFMQYPKSLTELTDPELEEAVDQMINVIYRVTGVDVSEWRKQIAHIVEEPQEAPQTREDGGTAHTTAETDTLTGGAAGGQEIDPINQSSGNEAGDGSGDVGALSDDAAASIPGDEPGQTEEAGNPATDMRVKNLMREALDKFLKVATDPKVPDAKDRQTNVIFTKNVWKAELVDFPGFVKACTDRANEVVKGEITVAEAREYLETLLP